MTKGEKGTFSAKANVSDLDAPGEKVMLRFVLAEERIRYAGGNGMRYHHMVVRALPGGAKGVALTKKSHEQTTTIDPEALRMTLAKYLDNTAKEEGPFPRTDRPLAAPAQPGSSSHWCRTTRPRRSSKRCRSICLKETS